MTPMIFVRIALFILTFVFVLSCKTYYIPIESFKEQFEDIDSADLLLVKIMGPVGYYAEYMANPIDYIKCVDKNNNDFELKNSPSIEIRFTDNSNKHTIYYFDRIFLQDTLIIGDMSRFIRLRKSISVNDLKLIEVQDGRKGYYYIE